MTEVVMRLALPPSKPRPFSFGPTSSPWPHAHMARLSAGVRRRRVLAPLLAWLGHRHGRSIKGGVALASVMLGFGAMFDAPLKAPMEAQEAQVKGDEENGEPPDPDVAPPKPSDG